ncbi:unnamed protein product [Brassica rapa]|uniref:Uncharacterized protein n=1 Tax=Brassica campestris TaxID=3711 RepID=A0A3P5YG61_BRACM|nr:unnamed protein product [Brassica rapa]VDC66677.1 unnamed protein product [Brassica rapa]
MRGWHISRSQPKVCMTMRSDNQKTAVKFTWMDRKQSRSDTCWKRIKQSIYGVRVTRFEIYMTAYRITRATITCHRDNIAFRCDTCYYFKQAKVFVFII